MEQRPSQCRLLLAQHVSLYQRPAITRKSRSLALIITNHPWFWFPPQQEKCCYLCLPYALFGFWFWFWVLLSRVQLLCPLFDSRVLCSILVPCVWIFCLVLNSRSCVLCSTLMSRTQLCVSLVPPCPTLASRVRLLAYANCCLVSRWWSHS